MTKRPRLTAEDVEHEADEFEGDIDQIVASEDEEAEVAHVHGEVEQVDQLLLRVHLQEVVGEVHDGLRLGEQLAQLELLEDVLVVEVDVADLREDVLEQLVLHAVVVLVELPRLVDEVVDVARGEEDHVLRIRVLEARHEGDGLGKEDGRHLPHAHRGRG